MLFVLFFLFLLAVVIPILDQERDKAIAVLLVSPFIRGHFSSVKKKKIKDAEPWTIPNLFPFLKKCINNTNRSSQSQHSLLQSLNCAEFCVCVAGEL